MRNPHPEEARCAVSKDQEAPKCRQVIPDKEKAPGVATRRLIHS